MRILIVEDEKTLAGQLAEQLRLSGFVTDLCHDGNEAGFLGETEPYDAIILDLGLPGRDGLSVLKEWRSKGIDTPVLVLTARGQLHEKIEGLNAGADDYLTKPFNLDELRARLQSMLRRASLPAFGPSPQVPAPPPAPGTLRVDPVLPRAWLGNEAIDLTQREWVLLDLLVRHSGQVVSREDVLAAWQSEPAETGGVASNALEVYVHRLRRKLSGSTLNIRNIRGLGYLLESAGAP